MEALRKYDAELQMFVDPPCELNPAKLRFQRWLVVMGKGEHHAFGPSTGELSNIMTLEEHISEQGDY